MTVKLMTVEDDGVGDSRENGGDKDHRMLMAVAT